MNAVSDWKTELQELLDRLHDGEFSEADRVRLNDLLRMGPQQRRCFITYMDVHSSLAWHGGKRVESGEWRVESESICGQWPLVGGQRVESRESRVESCIDIPEIPVINLQIPTLNARLSTLNSWTFSYSVATLFLAVFLLGAWSYTITHPDADTLAVKKRRSAMPSRGAEKAPAEFTFVGRVSGLVDCQWADESTATYPGAGVTLNRRYALRSGLMEITYDSGAKVILQGPCEYTVESPRGGFLKVGKLVARVGAGGGGRGAGANLPSPIGRGAGGEGSQFHSQSALTLALSQGERGQNLSPTPHAPHPSPLFAVRTPTALVEDLGTEFGVEVSTTGETASHVFQGQVRVRVEGAGDGGRGTGAGTQKSATQNPPSEILLSAGQSARVERVDGDSPRIIAGAKAAGGTPFVTHMPRRARIELFNTGIDLREGDEDPHWQLVARSDDPHFTPRPAVVTCTITSDGTMMWLQNIPARSQWISTANELPELPDRVTYTFRTTFELPNLVSDSAYLQGRIIADDYVTAIRLNGKPIPVPENRNPNGFFDFHEFKADKGFVKGMNTLEIDVRNEGETGSTRPASYMLLRVELKGYFLSQPSTE